jgi:hypothetical protein
VDDLWDISRQPSILVGETLSWGQSATDVTVQLIILSVGMMLRTAMYMVVVSDQKRAGRLL